MNESIERMKGKKVVKPIVYGNTAIPFGYKRESDQHTHQWTVFLKMFNAEDPTKFIRKVQFKLHDSYPNSTRVVEKPPYEVTETGWGEFEIQIRIYFVDMNEKPVAAFHYLRLFQPLINLPNGKTQVVAEYYDEIVFQEPTIPMYKALTAGEGKKSDHKKFQNDLNQICRRTVEIANVAREEIQLEIEDLRESLRESHKLMLKYKGEVDQDSTNSTPNVSICQG
uniref:YEATS domain-containing protein 4 n=1 Tax=Heterorhabditis bacteriophora TaxID=37862 RepID=A0A1I7XAM7_HETBA